MNLACSVEDTSRIYCWEFLKHFFQNRLKFFQPYPVIHPLIAIVPRVHIRNNEVKVEKLREVMFLVVRRFSLIQHRS